MKIKIEKPAESKVDEMGIRKWPIWTCEPSTFDWHYDQTETCYILEGDVGDVQIGPGDLVTFPKGLDCVWQVKKAVRKHYNFS